MAIVKSSIIITVALLLTCSLCAVVTPTPIQPDPTYQTGLVTVISSELKNFLLYTVNYNWAMSTSSLNASLGIVGMNLRTASTKYGFRMKVISLNQSALVM